MSKTRPIPYIGVDLSLAGGIGSVTVLSNDDGTTSITLADDLIAISKELMERADPAFLSVADDLVTITASNRCLVYRIVGRDSLYFVAEKVSDTSRD
jgi:hypothetical protein